MLKFQGIDHVVLRVRDVDVMMKFYVDSLGMQVEKIQADLGLYQLRAGNALLDLVTVHGPLGAAGGAAPSDGGRNMDHLCFSLSDMAVDEARALLKAEGIDVDPAQNRYGASGFGMSIYLQDPEGNTVELR